MTQKRNVAEQYRTSASLESRYNIYSYAKGPVPWHEWVFGKIPLGPTDQVLDVGCGPAMLWAGRTERLPPGVHVTLADQSQGMLEQAHAKLPGDGRFETARADIQSLPFQAECFDVVIALHVVSHADSVAAAISELRRVLRPAGRCFVSLPSGETLRSMRSLLLEYDPSLVFPAGQMATLVAETLEAPLREAFGTVESWQFRDELVVDNAEAIIGYYLSIFDGNGYPDLRGKKEDLQGFVEYALVERGPLRTESIAGLFACRGRSPE